MRLLLDQGLSRSAVLHLKNADIEAAHVGDRGLTTASDSKILDFGRQEDRIVVTLDADFHALLLALSEATGPYRAFVEGKLDAPKHLARRVHDEYFNPRVEEFAPRTVWSLSNAFTSAFKNLDPIPQFKTTAKLASFLDVATAPSN